MPVIVKWRLSECWSLRVLGKLSKLKVPLSMVLWLVYISPMKKGKKAEYFEAKLTDGLKQMRVVGFKGGHRKRLASFEAESQGSVSLQNCQVKKARQSDELEIVLKSSSCVEASPKKFATDCVAKILSSKITLDPLALGSTQLQQPGLSLLGRFSS